MLVLFSVKRKVIVMNMREFLKHCKTLARKGWRRAEDDIQVRLRRPNVRSHPNNYSFSPLSALYFHQTGRRTQWREPGTLSHGLGLPLETTNLIDNVCAYPNHAHPFLWKWGLKERLMRIFPVE